MFKRGTVLNVWECRAFLLNNKTPARYKATGLKEIFIVPNNFQFDDFQRNSGNFSFQAKFHSFENFVRQKPGILLIIQIKPLNINLITQPGTLRRYQAHVRTPCHVTGSEN